MNDSDTVFTATAANFQTAVLERSHETPVLVDFWAEWCAPCKMLMPILADLAAKAGGQWLLAKVDTDAEQSLAQDYQVRSLPTVKLFKNGTVVDEFMGALPESQVLAFLDRHIERESDRVADAADAQLAAGDDESALALYDRALAADPDNTRLIFRRLHALLKIGRCETVEAELSALPIALAEEPEAIDLRARTRFAVLAAQAPAPAELEQRLQHDDDNEALRMAAARAMTEDRHEPALELLLQLLTRDPRDEQGAAKDDMVAAFKLIDDADLVNRYRRRMFNLLH